MIKTFRIGLAALVITSIVYTGCKKSDMQPVDQSHKIQDNQKAMASKLAKDFFKSFSPESKSTVNTNTNGLSVLSSNQCGDYTITPTNQFFMRGDTSVTLKGKSIFTLTCSGANNNPYGPDGYNFTDTLYTTESGKGFINTSENLQKYNALHSPNTNGYSITGNMLAWARFATVEGNSMTEHHDFSTTYDLFLHGLVATKDSPATSGGMVKFRCSQTDIYVSSPEKNTSIRYAGYMNIQKDAIESYFFVEGETYFMKYVLDPVTKKVISGPTKANFSEN